MKQIVYWDEDEWGNEELYCALCNGKIKIFDDVFGPSSCPHFTWIGGVGSNSQDEEVRKIAKKFRKLLVLSRSYRGLWYGLVRRNPHTS